MQSRQDHPAVSFTSDHGVLGLHTACHVHFSYRSTYHGDVVRTGHILHNLTGRQVGYDRSGRSREHRRGCERQCEVFAHRRSGLVHKREPVHIRVDCEPDLGT